MRLLASIVVLLVGFSAQAKILLDHEKDPFPLIDVQIVIPKGVLSTDPVLGPAAYLLADVWEPASLTMPNEKFVDALGAFGASVDISLYSQYSFINFSFPWEAKQDYTELAKLLRDFWQQPRLTDDELVKAKVKAKAGFLSSLDNDQSLVIATLRRWLNKKYFNAEMLYADNLQQVKLADIRRVHQGLLKVDDVWVGIIAPEQALPELRKMIKGMFKQQGDVVEGIVKKSLDIQAPKIVADKSVENTFLLIDKTGLNQTVTSMVSLVPEAMDFDNELASGYGSFLLFNSGMSAVFFDEIREKRGLAYSVGGLWRNYMGSPTIGFLLNPLREKTAEAYGVVRDLVHKSFGEGNLYKDMQQERWSSFWEGYVNKEMLSTATPSSRLSKRSNVVVGMASYAMVNSSPEQWKMSRAQVKDYFVSSWQKGHKVAVAIGDAKELTPLVKEYFKGHKIVTIPYKQAVLKQTF